MTTQIPLTLLYDAACPVCALEMDHLRSRNTAGRLAFVDISQPCFDAGAWGLRHEALGAELHGVWPDGSTVHGMETLRLAYGAVGLGALLGFTGLSPLRPAFDLAYRLFARHRQRMSRVLAPAIDGLRRRRAARTAAGIRHCHQGRCALGAAPRTGAAGEQGQTTGEGT